MRLLKKILLGVALAGAGLWYVGHRFGFLGVVGGVIFALLFLVAPRLAEKLSELRHFGDDDPPG